MENQSEREKKNQYHREWCAKNKERLKVIYQRYWKKKLDALAASEQGENNDERKDT